MKLRSAVGSCTHYYKFTGITEIQCWPLYGGSPCSLRYKNRKYGLWTERCAFKCDPLGKSGRWQQLVLMGHRFALSLDLDAGSLPWLQMGCSLVIGYPHVFTHNGLSWGHSSQRMLPVSTGRLGEKVEMAVLHPPPVIDHQILLIEAQKSHLQR
jgi:hypothetical protein